MATSTRENTKKAKRSSSNSSSSNRLAAYHLQTNFLSNIRVVQLSSNKIIKLAIRMSLCFPLNSWVANLLSNCSRNLSFRPLINQGNRDLLVVAVHHGKIPQLHPLSMIIAIRAKILATRNLSCLLTAIKNTKSIQMDIDKSKSRNKRQI